MTHLSASTLRSSLLLCALAACPFLSTSHAMAQDQAMVAQIPFAFENGSQHLPAGKYRIDLTSESLLLFRSTGAHAAGFVMTTPKIASTAPQNGKIVFHRYGNRYFLSEVWMGGESTGRICARSRAEKHLQIAQNAQAATTAELALNAPVR